jgi:hypothetical protein
VAEPELATAAFINSRGACQIDNTMRISKYQNIKIKEKCKLDLNSPKERNKHMFNAQPNRATCLIAGVIAAHYLTELQVPTSKKLSARA